MASDWQRGKLTKLVLTPVASVLFCQRRYDDSRELRARNSLAPGNFLLSQQLPSQSYTNTSNGPSKLSGSKVSNNTERVAAELSSRSTASPSVEAHFRRQNRNP